MYVIQSVRSDTETFVHDYRKGTRSTPVTLGLTTLISVSVLTLSPTD